MKNVQGNYKVKVADTRKIQTGEKQTLQLINEDTDEIVKEQKVSFSSWQLQEGYQDRLKHWAKMRIRDINSDPDDKKGKELSI